MAKFVVYEKVAEAVYRVWPKKDMSDGLQTTVNLGSGLIAGFAAAIVSQPADTMLSKINKTPGLPGESTTSRLIKIGKELGIKGSFTGLGARLFMVGTLTAFQFAIYVRTLSLIPDLLVVNETALSLALNITLFVNPFSPFPGQFFTSHYLVSLLVSRVEPFT
jgi:Mitochondrial carrier protein.